MKLLHIISSVDPIQGGPIEGVFQQSAMAGKAGIEIHIASLDAPDAPWVRQCPAKVFALGKSGRPAWRKKTPWGHYGYEPAFVPWLRDNVHNYDAVIVNGLWNYATMGAKQALAGNDVPYAVFTHGMLDPWFRQTYPVKTMLKQAFWLFCEGPLMNRADAVFFTTKDEMIVSHDAFRPYHVKGKVVGFGTADVEGDEARQVAAFRAAIPALGDKRYLLYLSRIHQKKGVDMLIEAFGSIAEAYPDLDLVIAGPDQVGWCEDLQNLAAELGIAGRIHWPGMLTGDQKWGAFRDCEAFVLPSHQENFGVVVAEALACGKAVLISDKVQIWREVADYHAGIVKPDTIAGTRALLQEFAGLNPPAVASLEANARTLFEECFDIRKAFFKIIDAVTEIIPEKSGPA
ncbi:glycosyltransferase [Novosphingobium sp.]|uniref:glycosyltransferase n=1 Tax=Novosphingobium sp. TaxID=1874826 RepID=UPI003D0CF5D7